MQELDRALEDYRNNKSQGAKYPGDGSKRTRETWRKSWLKIFTYVPIVNNATIDLAGE